MSELDQAARERTELIASLEEAQGRLREADAALRSVMAERDEAVQQAADLQTRWEATDVQLRHLRLAFDNAGRERDELTVRLLALEQKLAGAARPGASVPLAQLNDAVDEAAKLQARLQQRRGTAKRLRAKNRTLRVQTRKARAEAAEARAALAARASLPRRVVRRLRAARRAEPS
jgi:chromosome segregation ATPase